MTHPTHLSVLVWRIPVIRRIPTVNADGIGTATGQLQRATELGAIHGSMQHPEQLNVQVVVIWTDTTTFYLTPEILRVSEERGARKL